MNLRFFSYIIAFLAAGCTVQPLDNGLGGQFDPPLFYKDWHSNPYMAKNGMKVCAVSSGYNGLTVTLGPGQDGMDVVVASNRRMKPGTTLTVDAGGRRFEAYDTYFLPEQGRMLVDHLSKGDKAYLEWSESQGPVGGQRVRVQNILRLDGFRTKMQECRKALGAGG